MNFQNKLDSATAKNNSLLCVGLDTDPAKLKKGEDQFTFNKRIIDQTSDLVCAYKPNIAFYGASGSDGIDNLKKTIEYIHKSYPGIPVLLDAKRGDVDHTTEMYVKEVFDFLDADAVTVNPYCGFDSVEPFARRTEKGVFVLCRTSNPTAEDFQDLQIAGGEPLYLRVAKKALEWRKKYKNIHLVVGSTWPHEIEKVREITQDITLLVPGAGAQGGDLRKTLENGLNKNKAGLIINASRSIIYGRNPKQAAKELKDEINKYR